MIFFTDECFMYKANKLVEAFDRDNVIKPPLDHFSAGTPDVEWIPAVAAWTPKPTIVCGDGRILRNKVERQVLKEAALTFICLSKGRTNLEWSVFAWKIIKVWPTIVISAQAIKPTVFEVSAATLKVEKSYQLS
jgi:hypothetical protein